MKVVKPFSFPPVVEAVREMYSRVPIPFAILNAELYVVWHNESMRESCPPLCQPDGLLRMAGFPVPADVRDEIAATGSFQVTGNPRDVFTPRGLTAGSIPGTAYYFIQASAAGDHGTWSRPHGLEKTLCIFENAIRENLAVILTAPHDAAGWEKIKRGAKRIQRAVTETLDYTRLVNGIYPSRKIRVDPYSFLCEIIEEAGRMIAGIRSFEYPVPGNMTAVYTVTDTLLLTELWGILLSQAAAFTRGGGSIRVKMIAAETQMQALLTAESGPPGTNDVSDTPRGEEELVLAAAVAAYLGGSLSIIDGAPKRVYRLTLPIEDDEWLRVSPRDGLLPLYPDIESFLRLFFQSD